MIKVLDHGFVRLVSYMQPVPRHSFEAVTSEGPERMFGRLETEWTGDLEIVRNARVSHDADWRGYDTADSDNNPLKPDQQGKDEKLIDYMLTNRHSSPFEAMIFTFEVKAPIFVFRQWHRHRTWSYNEVSARYTELPEEFYVPDPENIGVQSKTNKQGRDIDVTPENLFDQSYAQALIQNTCVVAFENYRTLLRRGVPRELARGILPLNTYSRMFATVDLHNLFHFLELRLHRHAQYEIRVYAQALLGLIEPIVPHAVASFLKANPNATHS